MPLFPGHFISFLAVFLSIGIVKQQTVKFFIACIRTCYAVNLQAFHFILKLLLYRSDEIAQAFLSTLYPCNTFFILHSCYSSYFNNHNFFHLIERLGFLLARLSVGIRMLPFIRQNVILHRRSWKGGK